jgi:DNA repair exonuclease SbcCD ATPase subunit
MKRSLLLLVLLMCVSASASAQQPAKSAPGPTSEQSLQQLVSEVRQLRATLQRMNAAVYKGQVLLERLKLQQEQVTRISRELAQVREEVQELRGGQQRMKEMVPRIQEGIDAGIKHPSELTQLKGELEQLGQREHRYAVRESRLVNDLEGATALLNDLNDKLNALVELEMTPK